MAENDARVSALGGQVAGEGDAARVSALGGQVVGEGDSARVSALGGQVATRDRTPVPVIKLRHKNGWLHPIPVVVSPDGTCWAVTVDDGGVITTVKLEAL